ncbi:dihydroorotase [Paraliobacillus quinghaiensis]|uniref:Dihydroorotase n=1 Tax=Paraliobacillus quinghaiensis TaxID=470815 RepID=A0A917WQJ2_9BACI|nr:dihydroorotase [Paraliobacillus quinghaiensis]GGM20836.1 dihydroorotase [Paraliobacillus quinghaiensis]
MQLLLTNAKQVLANNECVPCEVKIEDGVIKEIANKIENRQADSVIDCQGNLLTPGFIDVHVHLREPGGSAKETIETGTKAAARGGYTTVCSMPNTNPVPDNPSVLRDILNKIDDTAKVRVLPYASITKGLNGEQLTDMKALKEAGAFGFTDDGVGVQTADQMLQAMKQAAALNMTIVAHCEDNSLIHSGVVHDGEVSARLGVNGIPSICESVQIARDVLLAEATGCHYHVCHVSTKESVRVIRDAKRAGIYVTAEVTPHHLLLNEKDIVSADPNFKMNPPLRSQQDQQALFDGLIDGTIDFIATDHAPHTEAEKQKGINEAPFGIVGLETAFALLHTNFVETNKITLTQLIEWLTIKPAQVFGLHAGELKQGAIADLTLLNLEEKWVIDKDHFYSKGKNTPFNEWEVTGKPVLTLVNGEIVYKEAAYV